MTRNDILEEVAVMLARSYPGNVSTNAFCAAVRSMKERTVPKPPEPTTIMKGGF